MVVCSLGWLLGLQAAGLWASILASWAFFVVGPWASILAILGFVFWAGSKPLFLHFWAFFGPFLGRALGLNFGRFWHFLGRALGLNFGYLWLFLGRALGLNFGRFWHFLW